jgi:L-alanine-DL-glutamate epimerase-like enolase superfamily enzyme
MSVMIVEISDGRISGYGEATTNPYYQVTLEGLRDAFSRAAEFLKNYNFRTPELLWYDLAPILNNQTFAQSAIDCAAHDLFNKKKGRTFMSRWGISYIKFPLTSYTLGVGSVTELKTKIMDLPWPIYKIKVTGKDDDDIIRQLRKQTPALLRVDANCAWPLKDAVRMAEALFNLNVEFIEQPFQANQYKETRILSEKCPVPLIADESCQGEEDIIKCADAFDGINIKLAKCGGITPAINMIKLAKKAGLKVMIGCMTETTVGISAASQLLPFVDYADLDGPLLLSEDVATGIQYYNGSIIPAKANGLGFEFKKGKFSTELPS